MCVSPDDHTAQVVQHTSDVCNAVVAAHRSDDAMQIAFEILGVAMLIAPDNKQARSELAWFMRRCAQRLDGDTTDAMTLQ
jgi:hypothetical protein